MTLNLKPVWFTITFIFQLTLVVSIVSTIIGLIPYIFFEYIVRFHVPIGICIGTIILLRYIWTQPFKTENVENIFLWAYAVITNAVCYLIPMLIIAALGGR